MTLNEAEPLAEQAAGAPKWGGSARQMRTNTKRNRIGLRPSGRSERSRETPRLRIRPLVAFAFALTLSTPLHAESIIQPFGYNHSEVAGYVYSYCSETSANQEGIDPCFQRLYYAPMHVLFCLRVVFINASPPPSTGELLQCAKAASTFAHEALMDARGGKAATSRGEG